MNYHIRRMNRDELDIAIAWAAQEGWNPGLFDADSFFDTDPNGFFMGFEGDEPVSSISAVAYDDRFGFIGFYIVKPKYRGKGYGYQLWQDAMKYLSTQNIGLDGVLAQQENYKQSGFVLAYRNIRYEGKGEGADVRSLGKNIQMLSELPFEQFLSYDRQIFPANRPVFLKQWIEQPESLAIGYVENNTLYGYGMVRKCQTGYKVGPLFADSPTIATTLFETMRQFVGNGVPIFLDVPEVNKEAMALAERYGMKPMFETARMYTKQAPDVPMSKVFGVTTFELG
jgi:ribosomal protein S18 acetylase RimI-like enzyme